MTIRQQTVILLDLSYRDSSTTMLMQLALLIRSTADDSCLTHALENRTLLTIPEIRDEFWKILFGDKKVREKLLATGVKIAVF